jgi:hypothetical protein
MEMLTGMLELGVPILKGTEIGFTGSIASCDSCGVCQIQQEHNMVGVVSNANGMVLVAAHSSAKT